MNWFTRMIGRGAPEQRSVDVETLNRLEDIAGRMGGVENFTSEQISDRTALQVSAVMACVRVISEGCAALQVGVKQPDAVGVLRPVDDHPLNVLLNVRPNDWQTGFEFREHLLRHAALTGNGYAYIVRDGAGEPGELIPLEPREVHVEESRDHTPVYTLGDGTGNLVGRVDARNMLHLRGPSYNGWEGMNPVKLAANSIGLSRQTERSQAKLHANGGRPGGLLSTDETLSPDRVKQLAQQWKSAFSGNNQFRTAVLDGGMKFQALSMTGVDAQHLETRRFQIEEVCRVFNVFPSMIMHTDKASTYASAEAFFAAHLRHTLSPWLRRLESVLDRDLLDAEGPLCVKHDTGAAVFKLANLKDRAAFFRDAIEMGIYTRNEVRAMEGLPPVDGGDTILTPLNMDAGIGTGGDEDNAG